MSNPVRTTARSLSDDEALAQLLTPIGVPGSGRQRYAAAMHFNRKGQMSDAALEVFRILSPLDAENPAGLLQARGLGAEVPVAPPMTADVAINSLIDEADRYFAGFSGAGIAELRTGLSRWRVGPVTMGKGKANGVLDTWMGPALAALTPTHPALATAIAGAVPYLDWITYDDYPRSEVGEDFATGHAFASIFGESAAIPALDWDMGLFLIRPDVLYRDHCHLAPELYAPLTGPHGWRFGPDRPLMIKPAHEPVWNPPNRPHLTKVGPTPFLCFFVWMRDVAQPAHIIPARDWAKLEALQLTTPSETIRRR
jgi:hypothetical protein